MVFLSTPYRDGMMFVFVCVVCVFVRDENGMKTG